MPISPEEFRSRWLAVPGDTLVTAPDRVSPSLPPEALRFLRECGLPKEAAPFLSFESTGDGPPPLTSLYPHLTPAFARYLAIGSEGAGDPICIDTKAEGSRPAGAVVALNHDNHWQVYFLNSSVAHLAESLLACRALHDELADVPDDARDTNTLPPAPVDRFETEILRIDDAALESGSFWWHQLKGMRTPWPARPVSAKPWWKFWSR